MPWLRSQEDLDGADGDDPLAIYRLRKDGKTMDSEGVALDGGVDLDGDAAANPPDEDDIANAARVSIGDDDTSITVKLSNDWRSGGELVVILRNVQTAVPSIPVFNYR